MHFFLKQELQDICNSKDLATSGDKKTLSTRLQSEANYSIVDFLWKVKQDDLKDMCSDLDLNRSIVLAQGATVSLKAKTETGTVDEPQASYASRCQPNTSKATLAYRTSWATCTTTDQSPSSSKATDYPLKWRTTSYPSASLLSEPSQVSRLLV